MGERKVTRVLRMGARLPGDARGASTKRSREADAVATYNGASFDIPKLMGNFLVAGMLPASTAYADRHLQSRPQARLHLQQAGLCRAAFGLGEKLKHEGLQMWIDVMAGCPKAQRKMARYCAQDVRLLEDVYQRVLPYVHNHPHMGMGKVLQGLIRRRAAEARLYRGES
jgi:hypothetical protein